MKAKVITTDGSYLEAIIEIEGQELHVMDFFTHPDDPHPVPGTPLDVDISGESFSDESWEEIFQSNSDREKKLVHLDGWRYKGYGQITNLSPMIIDCGIPIESEIVVRWKQR